VVKTDRVPYYGGRELDLSYAVTQAIRLLYVGGDYGEVY